MKPHTRVCRQIALAETHLNDGAMRPNSLMFNDNRHLLSCPAVSIHNMSFTDAWQLLSSHPGRTNIILESRWSRLGPAHAHIACMHVHRVPTAHRQLHALNYVFPHVTCACDAAQAPNLAPGRRTSRCMTSWVHSPAGPKRVGESEIAIVVDGAGLGHDEPP